MKNILKKFLNFSGKNLDVKEKTSEERIIFLPKEINKIPCLHVLKKYTIQNFNWKTVKKCILCDYLELKNCGIIHKSTEDNKPYSEWGWERSSVIDLVKMYVYEEYRELPIYRNIGWRSRLKELEDGIMKDLNIPIPEGRPFIVFLMPEVNQKIEVY